MIIYKNKHVIIAHNSHLFLTVLPMHLHWKAATNGQPYNLLLFSSQIIKMGRRNMKPRSGSKKNSGNHRGEGGGGGWGGTGVSQNFRPPSVLPPTGTV